MGDVMSTSECISFQEAVEIGLQKAADSERIKAEVQSILQELNSVATKATNRNFILFDLSEPEVKQLSPLKFDFNNYSFPIAVRCGALEVECNSICELVESIKQFLRSAYFGDFIRMNINA
ncbi:hypothetical protein [Acinetobacter baumannii]|uniref:hypothetical protein n=1 Tax=Acinetobacter baumannii TaxID=470 RepID=UPI001CFAEBEA|nr:hypothetical protein [Acinetobacter baumannii]UCZ92825.1 hypothetical protein LHJ62_10420 [Acinetobacter baumannii]UCZ96623.1 hypothetical protein LHJ61_10425 [Acinetobacter baumannii]UDA00426.1 hypothetical protein LHJ64_10420 [Acinetobacter baumannii]UDA04221.1 hypothetical protein LHJ65_10420 [Acinetobacter baumannii]UDA08023.1 hypothetical protein LHJ63_10430 [Acinetobacter baumannii]